MLSLQELLAEGDHLGMHPDPLVALLEAMEDPLVEAEVLLPIVQTDPGLTSSLLRLCNSSAFGARREIGSVLGDPNDLALVLMFPASFAVSLIATQGVGKSSRLLGLLGLLDGALPLALQEPHDLIEALLVRGVRAVLGVAPAPAPNQSGGRGRPRMRLRDPAREPST